MQQPSKLPSHSPNSRHSYPRIALLFVAMVLGLGIALGFQHKCELGVKWFEENTIWSFPIVFAAVSYIPKRLWLSLAAVSVVFVAVNYGFAPRYLASVHPNGE